MAASFTNTFGKDSETSHLLPVAESSEIESSKSYHFTGNDYTRQRVTSNVTLDNESNAIEKKEEEENVVGFMNLPRKSKILLLLCSVANFASCLSYAVPSPFYPQEAEEKGISTEMTGVFFSVYEVIVFMTSPVFGLYMSKIGPRFLLLAGIFVAGAGSIVFGLLGQSPAGDDFLALSLVNRALISLGYSAFVTSMQVTVLSEIPGNEGLAFSLMEGSAGVGFMVGPAVGGALFEIGGFGLPFYTIGGVVSLCGGVLYFILPPIKAVEKSKNQPSVFLILLSPLVWVSLLCIMVCAVGMGFMEPTLAKHLDPFNLTTGVVGLFFLLPSLVYCVFTPVWGWMSDTNKIGQGPLLVIGAVITGISFLIIGPSPWLGFLPYEIWTIIVGLALLGMSQPSGMIPTIKCLTMAAEDCGLDDTVDTYGMVVGLYNCAYSFGAAAGPLLAGVLVENYGFNTGVSTVGGANFALAGFSLVYFLIRFKMRTKKSYDVLQDSHDDDDDDNHHHHNNNNNNQKQYYHKKSDDDMSSPSDVIVYTEKRTASTPDKLSSYTSLVDESDTTPTTLSPRTDTLVTTKEDNSTNTTRNRSPSQPPHNNDVSSTQSSLDPPWRTTETNSNSQGTDAIVAFNFNQNSSPSQEVIDDTNQNKHSSPTATSVDAHYDLSTLLTSDPFEADVVTTPPSPSAIPSSSLDPDAKQ